MLDARCAPYFYVLNGLFQMTTNGEATGSLSLFYLITRHGAGARRLWSSDRVLKSVLPDPTLGITSS